MRKVISAIALVCVLCGCLASCANNGTANKISSKDTLAKPRWVDPQKGKMWSKVNVVQIPLTAMENHILGPVKSVRYNDYKISEKDGSKVLDDSGYNVYDKFGHLVDQNEYNKDGKPKWKCTYRYDEKNKAVQWDFDFFDHEKYSTKVTFKYDDKWNKTEENWASSNNDHSRKSDYKYDDRGNEIEETVYSADGKILSATEYKYDNRGFQVEMIMKGKDGAQMSKERIEYDNSGNRTYSAYYRSDTTIEMETKETADNKGRTIERVGYKKDKAILGTTKMKYDDWDNMIEDLSYKPDGSIDTARWNFYTDFEYDSHGNAIKETWYKLKSGKKVATDVAEKKYEYY